MRYRLLVTLILATTFASTHSSSANEIPPIFVLHSERTLPGANPDRKGPLLQRELFRQAVLLTAREELGLSTRDSALRETSPSRAERMVFFAGIDPAFGNKEGLDIGYFLRAGHPSNATERLIEGRLAMLYKYEEWTAVMEELSRTTLRDLLLANGVSERVSCSRSGREANLKEIERLLAHLSELSQYQALRLIHAGLRANSESPELLGMATRAYANLGQLTREHWSVEHKVYQARALLYAERLVVKEDRSPWSLAHRAYARALVGRHHTAMTDMGNVVGSQVDLPWIDIVEAFLRFDTSRLLDAVEQNDSESQLAALLACLSMEFSTSRSERSAVEAPALATSPDTLRVHGILFRHGGVGLRRHLAPESRANFFRHLIETLPNLNALPGETLNLLQKIPASVPESVLRGRINAREPNAGETSSSRSIFERFFSPSAPELEWWTVAQLVETLRNPEVNTGEVEPSWSMLATLIEESNFTRVRLHLHALARSLSVEVPEELRQHTTAETIGHPLAATLPLFWVRGRFGTQAVRKLLAEMYLEEVPMVMMPLVYYYSNGVETYRELTRNDAYRIMVLHGDRVYDDVFIAADIYVSRTRENMLTHLLKISPNDPHTLARALQHAPRLVEERLRVEKETLMDNPTAAFARAEELRRQGNLDDAAAILEKVLPKMPDLGPYRLLAEIYLEQGDEKRWLKTLEHFIEHGHSGGLLATRAREQIARHYLETGRAAQAIPYAEAAAQSWASTPMTLAAECYFAAGQMERSLYWFKARHARYPRDTSPFAVFYWYIKTGLPIDDHIREEVRKAINGRAFNVYWNSFYHGFFHFYEGHAEVAVKLIEAAYRIDKETPRLGLVAAMMADHFGMETERDQLLTDVAEGEPEHYSSSESRTATVGLAKAFRNALAGETKATLNRIHIEEIIESAHSNEKVDLAILAGHFFHKRGFTDDALHFYRSALSTRHTNRALEPLAYNGLRALGAELFDEFRGGD